MSPRTTAILAFVALVLGAFVYFYEIRGGAERDAAREAERRLYPGTTAEAIESVELTTSDGVAARFERKQGEWRVVAPVEGRADPMALDGIASALAQLPRAGSVRSGPGDVAQFGLGEDASVVRFRAEDGEHVLRIGRATPVGGNVYVATDADEAVAYVERYRLNAFQRDLASLRDRRIVALEGDALVELGLAGADARPIVLGRAPGGDWRIEAPIAARADQQSVREVVSNLQYLQASGFVDERSSAVEAARAETVLEIRWKEGPLDANGEGGGEGALRIAGLLDGARLVEHDGRLYTLAPERLDDFPRSVDAYRDKQLVALDPDALTRIELAFPRSIGAEDAGATASGGASTIVLVRRDGSWVAEDRSVASDEVAALAETLAGLRAEAIVADAMGEAEQAGLGLAPPQSTIRIVAAATDEPGETRATGAASEMGAAGRVGAASEMGAGGTVQIELGRLDPDRGLFARRADEPIVYLLPASLAEALPLDLAAFEARFSAHDAERGPEGEGEGEGEGVDAGPASLPEASATRATPTPSLP